MTNRKALLVLAGCSVAFVGLTLAQDFLRASLKNSAFYLSESFMFSSFWWLFTPLLFAQYKVVNHIRTKQASFQAAIITLPLVSHIFAFPFLVWLMSKAFYYYTFSFQQILQYTLSEHVYLLMAFYSIPVLAYQFFYKETKVEEGRAKMQRTNSDNQLINTLLISEGGKKITINVEEILYFSAAPPYISIHVDRKKHLYAETLKSISAKLNPEQFVRVHKSTIVNMKMVVSYTSRLNGDYDLTMKNNVKLRVSRSFAGDFKQTFQASHRLTA